MRSDLKSKGIAAEILRRVAPGADDLDRAQAILRRKYRAAAATREERARRARFLQGRGFAHEVIRRALGVSSADTE